MALARWDPFRELLQIQRRLDRLMTEMMGEMFGPAPAEGWAPPVDMYETDSEVVVRAQVPGVRPEDIEVQVTDNNTLIIRGERKETAEVKTERYIRREGWIGRFFREITLPTPVDVNRAQATYEYGVLTLRLPKAAAVPGRRIQVQVKA